ncbi:MAG: hypothetical protein PHU78_10505 [Heliobacteriaceae bacterium]|nr:hypothetical protein [Heliobacteriaceae bacterium]
MPCAYSDEEAISNAKEAMALHLYSMEQDGDKIPEPTPVMKLHPLRNQGVVLVDVWMPVYRSAIEIK